MRSLASSCVAGKRSSADGQIAAQEALRRRVVLAVREEGMSKSAAARTFEVSRTSIHGWLAKFAKRGAAGLTSRRRGRPRRSRLAGQQAATIELLIF
jgi:transposase